VRSDQGLLSEQNEFLELIFQKMLNTKVNCWFAVSLLLSLGLPFASLNQIFVK